MRIADLEIENFMRIEHAHLKNMDTWGLTLIQGENRDDPSADSNGAGKSSLGDSISWCWYGKTARGTSGDEVIRRDAKKNCAVSTTIIDGGETYKIIRGRKHRKHGSAVHVFRTTGGGFEELTKGTNALTQTFIDQLVGATYEVFTTGVYAGQEQMPDLPSMSDKNLKEVVEKGAGIDRLIGAYERAKKRALVQDKVLDQAQAAFNTATASKLNAENNLADVTTNITTWNAQQNQKHADQRLVVDAKLIAAEEAKKGVDRSQLGVISAKRSEAQRLTEDAQPAQDRYTAALKAKTEAEGVLSRRRASATIGAAAVANAERAITAAASNITFTQSEVKSVNERVGTACGECSKPLAIEDLAAVRLAKMRTLKTRVEEQKAAQAALAEAQQNLQLFDAAVVDAEKALKQAAEAAEAAKPAGDTLQRVTTLQSEATALENTLRNQLEASKRANESYKAAVDKLNEIAAEQSPYQKLLANAELRVKEAEAAVIDTSQTVVLEGQKLALMRQACEVLGPAGVRAHILDTVTPFLNDRTGHYLGVLSDGNIIAEWSTIGYTAKAELREEFNIRVTNLQGADSFSGLSGGEKRKVRLASSMALQDLIATRATKPIGLYIADEIDDALDGAALERLMTLLEEKAKARGPVLLISHADLKAWVRDTITVVKEGGVSKIVTEEAS